MQETVVPQAEQSLAQIRAIILRWLEDYDASEIPFSLDEVLRLTEMQPTAPDAGEEEGEQ